MELKISDRPAPITMLSKKQNYNNMLILFHKINRSGESRKHAIVNYGVNARYGTAHVKGNLSKRHQGK